MLISSLKPTSECDLGQILHLLRPTGDESIRRDGLPGPFQLEVYEGDESPTGLAIKGNEFQESRKKKHLFMSPGVEAAVVKGMKVSVGRKSPTEK